MSSIYKKGRDGYYYYQTYVYNSDSGKKDKRVFHALGTKDLVQARAKQNELDLNYKELHQKSSKSSKNSLLPILAIILVTISVNFFVVRIFSINKIKDHSKKAISSKENEPMDKVGSYTSKLEKNNSIDIKQKKSVKENIINTTNKNIKSTLLENKPITNYTVERVDRLSGAFAQGKLYVTINKESSNVSQQQLCKKLVSAYNEFANIVICLYSNDNIGKKLASGENNSVNIEDQKRSWLAMYTYNAVEGEYFDDNPSRYLSMY